MEEFGSLTWITVSITRKLFSIVVHDLENPDKKISLSQWLGVLSVFIGLGLEVVMNYSKGHKTQKGSIASSKSPAKASTEPKSRGRPPSKSKTPTKSAAKSPAKSPAKSKSPARQKSPSRSKSPARKSKSKTD